MSQSETDDRHTTTCAREIADMVATCRQTLVYVTDYNRPGKDHVAVQETYKEWLCEEIEDILRTDKAEEE